MRDEAASAVRFESKLWQEDYPKIQIVTIEGLLTGTERIDAPSQNQPVRYGRQGIRNIIAAEPPLMRAKKKARKVHRARREPLVRERGSGSVGSVITKM